MTQVTSTQTAGTIVDQAPKPGVTLQMGWDVVLSVARTSNTTTQAATSTAATTTSPPTTTAAPPQPTSSTMPSVTQQTERAAVTAMNRLIYVRFPVTSGKVGVVVQQSPLAGGRAPKNAQVLVFLAVKR